ncbi:MAG: hypothetical protein R3F54_24790 [Alphaproteobacteria bacterium]
MTTTLGAMAADLYRRFVEAGAAGAADHSAIIEMLEDRTLSGVGGLRGHHGLSDRRCLG